MKIRIKIKGNNILGRGSVYTNATRSPALCRMEDPRPSTNQHQHWLWNDVGKSVEEILEKVGGN